MFDFDKAKKTKKIETFIRLVCGKEGYKNVFIGVSGGVDSATSLILSVRALGKTHVYPVLLPYGKLNDEGTRDALFMINSLGIAHENVTQADIKPFVEAVARYDLDTDAERKGRIMARIRMIILYDLCAKHNGLVIGTENKSEHLLGYYTRFGDEASDVEPIRELYKTQVYMLAKYLGVSQKILTKAPTAGLWQDQTDEGQFGFSYKIADEVLFFRFEKELTKAQIKKKGYDKKTVEKIWWWIKRGEFKARLPYTLD